MNRLSDDWNREWLIEEDRLIINGVDQGLTVKDVHSQLTQMISDPPDTWSIRLRLILLLNAAKHYDTHSLEELHQKFRESIEDEDQEHWRWSYQHDDSIDENVYNLNEPDGGGYSWFHSEVQFYWGNEVLSFKEGWDKSLIRGCPLALAIAAVETIKARTSIESAESDLLNLMCKYLVVREYEKQGREPKELIQAIVDRFIGEVNADTLLLTGDEKSSRV